jgi:hypothetical protein
MSRFSQLPEELGDLSSLGNSRGFTFTTSQRRPVQNLSKATLWLEVIKMEGNLKKLDSFTSSQIRIADPQILASPGITLEMEKKT